jgi:AcrR family transcriptional regulator
MATESSSNNKIPTKQRIITAALKSFAKKGIEQTKLIDIAETAKIKHNLILYHFKDFESLCLACVEQVAHSFVHLTQQVSLVKQKNAHEHLEHFIAAHFRMAQIHRGAFSIWLHFYYKASIDPHYQQLFKTITMTSTEKLKSILIQYCQEEKKNKSELHIELLAKTIISLIIGQLIVSLAQEKPDYALEAKSCYLLAVELL